MRSQTCDAGDVFQLGELRRETGFGDGALCSRATKGPEQPLFHAGCRLYREEALGRERMKDPIHVPLRAFDPWNVAWTGPKVSFDG
ncbi:hypothetical protein AKJ09_09245 [Labilithrix luteola]|uniref:Uncharacterized protein n=1 Tax=Labilithrix luteola TaxID=1391654 RepID=A0A0K1QA82_9BACT|nr:hypothetical protein AKJ09_09245 [Labilithrix luteola]